VKKTALVVNAGTHPEPYHVAVGLANIGWSVEYLTGSQLAPTAATRAIMRLAPVRFREYFSARTLGADARNLNRFFYEGLWEELLYLLLRHRFSRIAAKAVARRTQKVARRAARLLTRGEPYDLVLAQHTSALVPFASAPESTGRVLLQPILDAETLNSVLLAEAEANPSWAELLPPPVDTTQQKREIELSQLVITGSELVAQPIRRKYGKPVFCAHYGTVPSTTHGARPSLDRLGPLQLLFAGQANQRKGIGYLLDAVRECEQNFELRVAGQAGDRVRHRAADMPHVTFLGALSRVDLEREYWRADLLVLPSLAEGFALVVSEAMSTGLPCVVSDQTGAHEIIRDGENGFVVDAGDAVALRDVLMHLAANRHILGRVSERARVTAENLTWEKFGRLVASRIDHHQFEGAQ